MFFGVICSSSSLQGAGTDERTLTRIMISRSEIDLLNIRAEFVDLFDKSLHHMIEVRAQGHPSRARHHLQPGPRALGRGSRTRGGGAEPALPPRRRTPPATTAWLCWPCAAGRIRGPCQPRLLLSQQHAHSHRLGLTAASGAWGGCWGPPRAPLTWSGTASQAGGRWGGELWGGGGHRLSVSVQSNSYPNVPLNPGIFTRGGKTVFSLVNKTLLSLSRG